jgi:hypothetical protein
MKEFVSKWSNWWILNPKRKQLDDAFEKELNELIEREVALRQHNVLCCAECKEQELIEEMQREQYLHDLQWHENMNSLYTWDEGGFCDGFTK